MSSSPEQPPFSENDIKPVVSNYQDSVYGQRLAKFTHSARAASAISSIVPKDTDLAYELRRQNLRDLRERRNTLFRQDGKEPITLIEASKVKPMEVLDPSYLILMRMLVNEEYKKHTKELRWRLRAREIKLTTWAKTLFPEEGEVNKNLQNWEGKPLPEEQINGLVAESEHMSLAEKRRYFTDSVISKKEYLALRNEANKELLHLLKEEYYQVASEILYEEVTKVRAKDKLPKYLNGRISCGLELELTRRISERNKDTGFMEQTKTFTSDYIPSLDALQHLGIPVGYDAARELSLPYSENTRGQLRAVTELVMGGYIRPGQSISVHLNLGGIEFTNDFFFLEKAFLASDLFHVRHNHGVYHHVYDKYPRLLYEDGKEHDINPSNTPFRVRPDGVVEFRVAFSEAFEYSKFVKGTETIGALCEALLSYQKVEDCLKRGEEPTETDVKLSSAWVSFRQAVTGIVDASPVGKDQNLMGSEFTSANQLESERQVLGRLSFNDGGIAQKLRVEMIKLRSQVRTALKENQQEITSLVES